MVEESRPWAGTTLGDAGPYSDDDWDDIWEVLFGSGAAPYNDRGVIRNWANELAGTDGGANTFDVATGAALVHGKFYKNTAVVNVNIPSSVGAWREDLICLHSSWVAQTIRIARHANPADGVAYPAPTQTDGSCWEIPLWAVRINNAGAITLITDLRDYVSDLMQPKSIFVRPFIPADVAPTPTRGTAGYHEGAELNAISEGANMEFMVPDDFISLLSAHVRLVVQGTGTFDWTANAHWGGCGQAYNVNSDTATADAQAASDDEILCLDVMSAIDPGLEAGDQVGLKFVVDAFGGATSELLLLGLDFRYR